MGQAITRRIAGTRNTGHSALGSKSAGEAEPATSPKRKLQPSLWTLVAPGASIALMQPGAPFSASSSPSEGAWKGPLAPARRIIDMDP